MFRIPHCLDNRLTDGGPAHRPHIAPLKRFSVCGTHFYPTPRLHISNVHFRGSVLILIFTADFEKDQNN
jgi:hypothetical protein